MGMPALGVEGPAEVDEAFESKGLTFKDWRSIIKNPDDVGVMEEGKEFDGELESGEPPWVADGVEGWYIIHISETKSPYSTSDGVC